MPVPAYSFHAQRRMIQRNLTPAEIEFILTYADPLYNAGVIFYQLKHRNFPSQHERNQRLTQLIGTTVVVCNQCQSFVLTTYRNESAFKKDRSKAKHNLHRRGCPVCSAIH